MAISFSRPDPSSPSAVAAATFSTGRRGYDQNEVRDLLRMVAAELSRLQERERFLERELRAAQHSSTSASVALDDEVVTRMLGEEAARILQTAREAASQIKIRAEENASRSMREAVEEAQRLRTEADEESMRRRADAHSDAESELEMAKQQGRDMVNEARSYRERVLGELSRRRELARHQIEQLVHGRDRLLQAFERARLAAVDVMAELTPVGAPAEFVDLSPTTGPVPVTVPAAALPHHVDELPGAPVDPLAGIDEIEPPPPLRELALAEPAPVSMPAPAAVEEELAAEDASAAEDEPGAEDEPEAKDQAADEDDAAVGEDDAPVGEDDAPAGEVAEAEVEPDEERSGNVVALFAGELPGLSVDTSSRRATDLFAQLRASRVADVARRAGERRDQSTSDSDLPADTASDTDSDADTEAGTELDGDADTDADATAMLARPDAPQVFQRSPEAPDDDSEYDDSPFGRRDAELTPLIVVMARKVKRVLADEQNEALHALRKAKAAVTVADLLPAEPDHLQRFADALAADLKAAAAAGARSVDTTASTASLAKKIDKADATAPAVEWLDQWLVAPLRERFDRAVVAVDGDNGELATLVRSIYREWKSQRIDEHLDDIARMAYGRGQLAAVGEGTAMIWVTDPGGPACPDCEDNSLAGEVAAGQPFPTTHLCAPAHEGCRCLLVRAPR